MFYERLYEALEILVDFFHADQKGLPLESIKSGETDSYQKLTTHICDMIYLLTAIGLPPSGSNTVHIYTQTIHRTMQLTQTVHRTTQFTN